jgi:hypothetical protein
MSNRDPQSSWTDNYRLALALSVGLTATGCIAAAVAFRLRVRPQQLDEEKYVGSFQAGPPRAY